MITKENPKTSPWDFYGFLAQKPMTRIVTKQNADVQKLHKKRLRLLSALAALAMATLQAVLNRDTGPLIIGAW